jgi:putative ABC transport system ATP-binding protein
MNEQQGASSTSGDSAVPRLRVLDLSKRVRDGIARRTIFEHVSFELHAGEFATIRGRSGSGKTTLLAVLGALLAPTSGEVWLDGSATSRLRERFRAELRRQKIAFLFQDFQLLGALTVLDNVLLPRLPRGIDAHDEAEALQALEAVGLASFAGKRAQLLSGGERQRIALVRALYNKPDLILLDEPTAALDDAHTETMLTLLQLACVRGATVVAATHDARLYAHPCVTRRFALDDGKLTDLAPA